MKLRIFLTISMLLSCTTFAVSQSSTSSSLTDDVVNDDVVMGFKTISTLVHALSQSQNDSLSGKFVDTQKVEQALFELAKSLDGTILAVKSKAKLDEPVINAVFHYSQMIQRDVANVNAGVIAAKQYLSRFGLANTVLSLLAKLDLTDMIVVTLETYVPGFDKLYRALESAEPPAYKNEIGSLFVSIICDIDSAAEALRPGVRLTGAKYCTTYSATGKPDLENCPNKPWPTLPKMPKTFNECRQSCGSVLKFGYQNSAWNKPDNTTWCTPTAKQPDWTPCTKDWTPKQWIRSS